ncbi:uncharacterized protein ARMOST_15301 [Armillaria ostoyae]|uniref:Uncharacterized protein n=1 Tax=Armillaria ostoyae TaxID=47428 RepID=A0A284RT08_ARMOS|nr:uncharacterized protein ARMOST_15301 [Armillaria ostoyae]
MSKDLSSLHPYPALAISSTYEPRCTLAGTMYDPSVSGDDASQVDVEIGEVLQRRRPNAATSVKQEKDVPGDPLGYDLLHNSLPCLLPPPMLHLSRDTAFHGYG